MNNLFKILIFQLIFFITNLIAEDNIPPVIVEIEEIINIENANPNIKLESQKRLRANFSE